MVYKRKHPSAEGCFHCGQGGNRTSDTRIFSPLLYRLSYLTNRRDLKKLIRYLSIIFSIFLFPLDTSAKDYNNANYYLEKGRIQFDNQMYRFAQESLERAISIDTSLYAAANMLGEINQIQKDFIKAEQYFNLSLSINDNQDIIHYKAGELDDRMGKNAEALSHFTRALELNPKNTFALIGAARIYSIMGDYAKADQYLSISNDLALPLSTPFVNRGNDLYLKKNISQAIKEYEAALENNRADPMIYFSLEAMQKESNDILSAIATMEKLIYIRPHDDKAHLQLAYLYYLGRSNKNRYIEIKIAAQHIESAISIKPSFVSYRELALEIYSLLDDEKKINEHKAAIAKLNNSLQENIP